MVKKEFTYLNIMTLPHGKTSPKRTSDNINLTAALHLKNTTQDVTPADIKCTAEVYTHQFKRYEIY